MRRSYYGIPFSAGTRGPAGPIPSGPVVEQISLGREQLAGHDCEKHRLRFAENDGFQLEGLVWISSQQILMRIEGQTVELATGRARPFRLSLANLEVAPQPDVLFEIPEGYQRVSSGHPTLGLAAVPARGGRSSPTPAEAHPWMLHHSKTRYFVYEYQLFMPRWFDVSH